jgi:hypothetical protein
MLNGLKRVVSSRFNIKKWMGFDQIKDSAQFIGDAYKDLSPKKEQERQKAKNKNLSFEEIMQMQRLTDADIEKNYKTQKHSFFAFAGFALLPLVYAFYLFYVGLILGGIVSLLGAGLCLAYAFRARVVMYQYRHRVVKVDPKAVLKELFQW